MVRPRRGADTALMNIFLVEDSPQVRERLVELIEAEGAHRVVGQAGTYDEAVAGILASAPDVSIFDIKLSRGNGIDVLTVTRERLPDMVGIVMSNHATPQHVKASMKAGASFFLDKSSEFERIPEILASIASARTLTQTRSDA
jgi:two-component system, NarL family, response regulator DevR